MTTSHDNLVVAVRQEQRSVSISEEREVVMWPMEGAKIQRDRSFSWDTSTVRDRKESTTSFLNPAINFARRMSLKITGNRGDVGGKRLVVST